jgi:hypothetical protein
MTAVQGWSLYLPWGGQAALVPALAEIASFGVLRLDGAFSVRAMLVRQKSAVKTGALVQINGRQSMGGHFMISFPVPGLSIGLRIRIRRWMMDDRY